MYAKLITFAGLMVGVMGFGDFKGATDDFREEMERNHAWVKVAPGTLASALESLTKSYNAFTGKKDKVTAKDIGLLIPRENHMYSLIHQEASLRTDSHLVNFLREDLLVHLDQLGGMGFGENCATAIENAKRSVNGSFNNRTQSNNMLAVLNKCK